ncbi:MAG: acetylxylan esterase [Planctomycetales bacterium]|nr:acetylxylan esterase [Planctomycetales bacterium]
MRHAAAALILLPYLLAAWTAVLADEPLVKTLKELDTRVYTNKDEQKGLAQMLGADIRKRRKEANERETAAWTQVKTRENWEQFRDARIKWLGRAQNSPASLNEKVTGTFRGDGYEIENLVFESRPGLLVSANLYKPAELRDSMPGILLCHSHHAPKTQGELQDMGISWAKQGCLVLVMDQLGHGERRQHRFRTAADYQGEFRPSRQDYYFRYNSGMQLHLIGESLIGWMANDISRGVDLLLARKGVDPQRIILLGAVAGGGDPAAVAAALDQRITAVVPFNFGGPQPETTYPLPPNSEQTFNYFGGGSWESTRNISGNVAHGYAPWVIVGAAAPRRLVYAHEFSWDQEHDPVWKRLQTIYGFYGAADSLASTHGEGSVRGSGAGNTHCTNIGPIHRVAIDEAFQKWFKIEKPSHEEMPHRKAEELACFIADIKPTPLHELLAKQANERAEKLREDMAKVVPPRRAAMLAGAWFTPLGNPLPRQEPKVHKSLPAEMGKEFSLERLSLEVEPGILVPLVLLRPGGAQKGPLVVAISQHGKGAFFKERAGPIAELLESGMAVCLPDLRGTGETSPDEGRGRNSSMTDYSSSELMLGETMVGMRVRDLRSVLQYLRSRQDVDGKRIALWGDSFAPVNPAGKDLAAPLDAGNLPPSSEPLGGLVVLLTALLEKEKDVRAVYSRRGLVSYQSLLESPYVYVPHDVIIPGAIPAGDLPLVVEALTPRKVRLVGQVDGQNRLVKPEEPDELLPVAWLKEALK